MSFNWREKLVCRILLMIASLASDNEKLSEDIRTLGNTISCGPMGKD